MERVFIMWLRVLLVIFLTSATHVSAETSEDMYTKRMELYKHAEKTSLIPWYYFAAIDQYERSVRQIRKDIPKSTGALGIYMQPSVWTGPLNKNPSDKNPFTISQFGGLGKDGNGDGNADSSDDEDIITAIATYLQSYGTDNDHLKIALWNYYHRSKTVELILGKAKLYKTHNTLQLDNHAFPMPIRANYTLKNTWGAGRGWGGKRIHEGTDIFADYGVPVRATCYGIVELKGWNLFGGWRIGIRDLNNTYHYYAHMSGFANDLKEGTLVEPGMFIGSVGSSGYGPPGTSGKFPPHLHYGMYKDNGRIEWAFDPYPLLKQWEQKEKIKKKK